MYIDNESTFLGAVVWLLACLAAWAGVRRWAGEWSHAHPRLAIAAAAAVSRAVPALFLDRGLPFDISAHWWVGNLALAGRNVYTAALAQNRYPYPPLHMYVSALMVWVSNHSYGAFLIADKLIPAACGVGIAVTLWAIALHLGLGAETALLCGLLYAVNPLPVLVTSYHGQFEEIPLLFITLALYFLLGERQRVSAAALSALCLGVAIAYKSWPLIFLPSLLLAARGLLRRALYLPLAGAPLALSLGLYGLAFGRAGFWDAVHRMLGYKGSNGFCWGYVSALHECWIQNSRLQHNLWVLELNSKLLPIALLLVGLLLLWRRRVLEAMVAFPLTFYLFSPGWGPNYSVWVLPFALLLSVPFAARYTILMLPLVSLTYLDSLYAAYAHHVFSWAVLKPMEGALGLLAWAGIVVLLGQLYSVKQPLRSAGPTTKKRAVFAGNPAFSGEMITGGTDLVAGDG